jgi:adenosylhomocysteinase
VVVTEIDPLRALEAVMDGFRVERLEEVAPHADIVITVTGDINVVDRHHMAAFKDGVLLANSGHFNDEINLAALDDIAESVSSVRPFVDAYRLIDGRTLHVLAQGRLLNLAAAEGHPAAVMDMSFANQALASEYMIQNATELEKKVYPMPEEIDKEIARLKLATKGVEIDSLTETQEKYLASWDQGT